MSRTRQDIANRKRDEVELPRALWKIAKDLEKIDRLAVKHRGVTAAGAGAAVDPVLSAQGAALEAGRRAVASRVTALEEYAHHVLRRRTSG